MGRMDPCISHVFYTDNCLLLDRATTRESLCLQILIDFYCAISGQVINVTKLCINFGPSIFASTKAQIRRLLQISIKDRI